MSWIRARSPLVTFSRQMSSNVPKPAKLAILDDYLSTSKPHFAAIPSAEATITEYKDTLAGFDHPNASDAQREEVIARLKPFDVVSCMRERTPFPSDLLKQLPNLKLLLVTGTQFQSFALDTAKELGIAVATSKGQGRTDRPDQKPSNRDIKKGSAHSTTQHAWALILALARNVAHDDKVVKAGGWQTGLATNLLGKTIGIVGLGRLGAATAKIGAQAWGMKVISWSENLTQEKADRWAEDVGLPVEDEEGNKTFKHVSKADLFRNADVVSVHYVLSPRSRGVIGKGELSAMKKSALFVNTSRGPLVDSEALLDVLEKGAIKGAAVDVYDTEPLPLDSPFRSYENGRDGKGQLVTTPHMGYVEEELVNNWYAEQAENLERWLEGKELLNRLV